MNTTDTHYTTLGVGMNATEQEIKKAFRNKVKKYHPDINPTKEAEDKIRKITEAYEVLSDVEKRKSYDEELKRDNRTHFEEQSSSTQSNPYASYSKERDESDFEDWIKIYLKILRSMDNKKNTDKHGIFKEENITFDYIPYHSVDFSNKSFHSQSQYSFEEEQNIKLKIKKW